MELNDFKIALEELKKITQKRNFKQSYDIIINLKDYDIKRTESHVDFFATLPFKRGKPIKICGLVGPELKEQSNKAFDKTILQDEFATVGAEKKDVKKLAVSYDYFVAQGNIMALVAKSFGRVFGPKQKMPNPKAGCVVPPNANLEAVREKLAKTVRLAAKTEMCIKCRVGVEGQDEKEILENMMAAYNQSVHHLPNEENNIRNVLIKLTMSKTVEVGKKTEKGEQPSAPQPAQKKEKPEEKKEEKSTEEKPKAEQPAEEKAE